MKITKSTRNTIQVSKMTIEVSRMNVFTTSIPVTQMNENDILNMNRIVIRSNYEEENARRRAQEEENAQIRAQEEENAQRRAPSEAARNVQEERERRRAENPIEYARLFNDSINAEAEWHAAMLAAEAAGGDNADANYLVVTTHSAYVAAELARINF